MKKYRHTHIPGVVLANDKTETGPRLVHDRLTMSYISSGRRRWRRPCVATSILCLKRNLGLVMQYLNTHVYFFFFVISWFLYNFYNSPLNRRTGKVQLMQSVIHIHHLFTQQTLVTDHDDCSYSYYIQECYSMNYWLDSWVLCLFKWI